MNRRRALQSLSAGVLSLCGCLNRTRAVVDSSTDRSPPPDVRRTIDVSAVSDGDLAAIDIEPSVAVVRPFVTDDHTARVRLSLRTDRTSPVTMSRTRCPPADVHAATRQGGDPKLVLLAAEEWSADPATPECWRPDRRDFAVGQPCGPADLTIPADEPLTRTYEVWDHPDNDSCMPPGEYAFGETYRSDDREYGWGFTLAVRDPARTASNASRHA